MMPAQGSAISDTTHFTGGQVDPPALPNHQMRLQADVPPLDSHETTIGKTAPFRLVSCPGPACLVPAMHAVLKPSPPADLQVLLPSGRVPNLGCPEHLGDMDMMQQVTPPPKRPPLPRLDIPGAPSGAHLPTSAAHNVRSHTFHLTTTTMVKSARCRQSDSEAPFEMSVSWMKKPQSGPSGSEVQRLRDCVGAGHADAPGAD